MTDLRIVSFNVENLFSRPKVFGTEKWSGGKPYLDAYHRLSDVMSKKVYSAADKAQMIADMTLLDIYRVNAQGVPRRNRTNHPRWAWFRKNRGSFDTQPRNNTKPVEIVASGRDAWVGWVELAVEAVDVTATRMTAKVIAELQPDILGIVEAEDRPSLKKFNKDLLDGQFDQVMLVDGNDERGIDVGIMVRSGIEIDCVRSNVDTTDSTGVIFSRDCPEYDLTIDGQHHITVLVNHFKSKSGGGDAKRKRQARRVRKIARELIEDKKSVIVLGDLNEGLKPDLSIPDSIKTLVGPTSPLRNCWDLKGDVLAGEPTFDDGGRPGSFGTCGKGDRLDYILLSPDLAAKFDGGQVYRRGLWRSPNSNVNKWIPYPEIDEKEKQASDHAAIVVDLKL